MFSDQLRCKPQEYFILNKPREKPKGSKTMGW